MSEADSSLPTSVVAALRRVLRPLVRLMIRHGITLPTIVELLKQVLVDVVEKDLPVEGKRTTDSRVSVLTGVHRKDVKRLRDTAFEQSDVPKSVSLGIKLVNLWITDPRWLDQAGEPLALPRVSDDPAQPSFEKLADSVSNDVRARAILDELLRNGVVKLDAQDIVRLVRNGFVPSDGEEQKLLYFERSSYAHMMAAVHNLEGKDAPYFDRVVRYTQIPAESLPALKALLEDKGMALLREVNSQAKAEKRSDAEEPQELTVGLYLYHEPEQDD